MNDYSSGPKLGTMYLVYRFSLGAGNDHGSTNTEEEHGTDIAEAMGTLAASIGIAFGKSFCDEESVTVGMPTVFAGGDVAVSFPWGRDYESRQCFTTDDHPFWVILRLSHTRR